MQLDLGTPDSITLFAKMPFKGDMKGSRGGEGKAVHFTGKPLKVDWTKKGAEGNPLWHHFCVTWVGKESYGYLDGNQVSKGRGVPDGIETAASFGKSFRLGNATFDQDLDEFASWGRALSKAEVTKLYQSGKSGQSVFGKDLRAKWAKAHIAPDLEVKVANLIKNGSFEAGFNSSLSVYNPDLTPLKFKPENIKIITDDAADGKRCAKITIPLRGKALKVNWPVRPGNFQLTSRAYRLNPAQEFRFSEAFSNEQNPEVVSTRWDYPITAVMCSILRESCRPARHSVRQSDEID